MRALHDFADRAERSHTLVLVLPGAQQKPEDLVQSGFIAAVRCRQLALDLCLIDPEPPHLAAAVQDQLLQQLHDELVLPAQCLDYKQIWLAGVSLGALMWLAYLEAQSAEVGGLCLLSPYPGNRLLTAEILAAGGITAWRGGSSAEDDGEVKAWQWLKRQQQLPALPSIHLGYGQQDRFAAGQALIAQTLPAASVDVVEGGHDAGTSLRLWENFLDRHAFVRGRMC